MAKRDGIVLFECATGNGHLDTWIHIIFSEAGITFTLCVGIIKGNRLFRPRSEISFRSLLRESRNCATVIGRKSRLLVAH